MMRKKKYSSGTNAAETWLESPKTNGTVAKHDPAVLCQSFFFFQEHKIPKTGTNNTNDFPFAVEPDKLY